MAMAKNLVGRFEAKLLCGNSRPCFMSNVINRIITPQPNRNTDR